jgi:MATE family multidrug resistance protein
VVFALIFAVFGTHMIPLFTDQPAVRAAACRYLPWLIAMPLVAVWGYQCDGVFIGATRSADLRNSMILSLAGFLLFSFLFCRWWANDGLWAAFLAFMALRGLTLGLRLKRIPAGLEALQEAAR